MRKLVLMLTMLAVGLSAVAAEPDILVTQAGESMKVYNLEVAAKSVIYTLSEAADSPLQKIAKEDILIIKMADGTKLDFSDEENNVVDAKPAILKNTIHPDNERDDVIIKASSIGIDKNERKAITLEGSNTLTFIVHPDNTLELSKAKIKYERVIIPDYIEVANVRYPITKIGKKAFAEQGKMTTIQFPKTLKIIDEKAFILCSCLTRIILPEGIDRIGKEAFKHTGAKHRWDNRFKELYIPSGVKEIGDNAFRDVGNKTSPAGYYQGVLTGIPTFINILNCTDYGIDEEAIENYEKQAGRF